MRRHFDTFDSSWLSYILTSQVLATVCSCHQICSPEPSRSSRLNFTFRYVYQYMAAFEPFRFSNTTCKVVKPGTHFILSQLPTVFIFLIALNLANFQLASSLHKCESAADFSLLELKCDDSLIFLMVFSLQLQLGTRQLMEAIFNK